MCEPRDPLAIICDLAMDVLMLPTVIPAGNCEKRVLDNAARNIHNELLEMVKRIKAERERK